MSILECNALLFLIAVILIGSTVKWILKRKLESIDGVSEVFSGDTGTCNYIARL